MLHYRKWFVLIVNPELTGQKMIKYWTNQDLLKVTEMIKMSQMAKILKDKIFIFIFLCLTVAPDLSACKI